MTESRILVVEDDHTLNEALCDTLELAGHESVAVANGAAALEALDGDQFDLVVSDVHMEGMDGYTLLQRVKAFDPELPVLLMTAYGTIEKAVAAMREGAVDYLAKPFEPQELVKAVARYARRAPTGGGEFVAESARGQELMALAGRVAATDATVMITGESGTGKEVLARAIHARSARSDGPFVAINCAAIPESMLEATLFGYEKGAFTGAHKRTPGKFEQAQGGTLLLDEISEMDLDLQAKLLRVLQEREVEPLGGGRTVELDVRVLATSNREMREEVAADRFREDLYYRLNVFPLHIPPLRERPEDIAPLAERLLARTATGSGRPVPALSAEAAERLRAHDWPGNVRELDNVMQRALILQPGDTVGPEDLHFEVAVPEARPRPGPARAEEDSGLGETVRRHEYERIREALKRGSRKDAAEELGISPRTLRYKLARMREDGFDVPERVGAQSA
ncbi:MAG TPA: sigma-54 dependent transcriptional regulator [Gammaproteobacteria bacterium]|nr:sigma-54 dependent transcriptional regulator [Gammaproteobacteria bacterium]